MKTLSNTFTFFLVILAVLLATSTTAQVTTDSTEYMARLNGQGFSADLNVGARIKAVRTKNGEAQGEAMFPNNFKGHVVELTSPSAAKDYWCVNSVVRDIEGLEGYNFIWFVKDVSGGPDLLSYTSGYGVTCATGTPDEPFNPVDGDFKTDVKYF